MDREALSIGFYNVMTRTNEELPREQQHTDAWVAHKADELASHICDIWSDK